MARRAAESAAAPTATVGTVAEPLPLEQAEALARRLASHHFRRSPRRMTALGGGQTNAVFGFRIAPHDYIIRINANANKIQDFLKEHWAMDHARHHGVATPTVLEAGNAESGPAYMILQAVPGIIGSAHADRLGVLRQLGELAQKIHAVRTHGFGPVFDWSKNRLSKHGSWGHFLDHGLHADERIALLARHRLVSKAQAAAASRVVESMRHWRRPPVLHHGDLRLKNTLVDPASGRVVCLLDWENCASGPAPYWDLSIALHDLGVDEKDALLRGYGLAPGRISELTPCLTVLNLLNYARAVGGMLAAKDREQLAWTRSRLQGHMDLHRLEG